MTGAALLRPEIKARLDHADPRVFSFIEAWMAARHGKLVPYRDDFDPMSVPTLLGSAWLYRYEPDLGDFVCRLAGEEIKAAWRGDLKGRSLREIIGDDDHAVVVARWRLVMAGPLIQFGAASEPRDGSTHRRVERLVLPLAEPGAGITHMLGLSLYALSRQNLTRTILVPDTTIQIPCADL